MGILLRKFYISLIQIYVSDSTVDEKKLLAVQFSYT